ncbi:MAG TPA: glutamate--tRNA ligase family protein [Euzebya sp.]|nr:glutamate--tRNA ligase family protein [Euzebya sp.]
MSTPLRVRFCPAPSGWLHVGSARTALFNWLWARRHDGTFVLRIEDTDAERATIESAEGMMAALDWLGLGWEEGPAIGAHAERGGHGPYLQSQRRPLHDAVVRLLVKAGHAYEAFETTEELEAARADGVHVYKTGHRDLTGEQRAAFRAEGRQPVVRVRTPDDGSVTWQDAVRGTVTFDWTEIGDFVVARADGSPTYMLANVVDDLSQGIGFVARGEDLLSVTPRQLQMASLLTGSGLLDEALTEVGYPARDAGWSSKLDYAHMPLLVGEDRKKLSKRHGAVAIDAFRDDGILPEAMLNFLALCGWSPGGDRERMSVDELVEEFDFERVQSSPAFFDTVKLRSLNGDAIKELTDADFGQRLVPVFERAGLVDTPATGAQVALIAAFAPHLKGRCQTLVDALPFIAFAFRDDVEWDDKAVKKWLKPPAGEVLDHVTPRLAALEEWTAPGIMAVFEDAVATLGVGMGKAMQPVRVVVTGSAVSPPLPETLAVLDQGWVLARLKAGRSKVAEG